MFYISYLVNFSTNDLKNNEKLDGEALLATYPPRDNTIISLNPPTCNLSLYIALSFVQNNNF